MGRTLKRVALDFNWPNGKVWEGYLNPHRPGKCSSCDGSGYAPEAKKFYDQWYGHGGFDPAAYGAKPLTVDHPKIQAFARRQCERSPEYYGSGRHAVAAEATRLWMLMRTQWCHHLIQADVDALLESDRLWDLTRVPLNPEQVKAVKEKIAAGGNSWLPGDNGHRPTADEVNAWSIDGFGHDAINAHICLKARCKREGVPYTCDSCEDGESWSSPELKKAHDEWTETDPPAGPGYQLWSTTSEGSPMSPVFATLDELCVYAAKRCSTFADEKATAAEWKKMLEADMVVHREGNNIFC